MSGFSADWLAAREAWDHRARSGEILRALNRWSAPAGRGPKDRLAILDLGCGTGSTGRYLDARLDRPLAWRLVDGDPALLAIAGASVAGPAPSLRSTGLVNLATADLERLIGEADLVTASALIDLVSRPWLGRFWQAVVARQAAVLAGLTYDGRAALFPAHPMDATIRDLVNRHQATDKGFGPALGPAATAALATMARRSGWRLMVRRSDWELNLRQDQRGLALLLGGWAGAATELAPGLSCRIDAWLAHRLATPDLRARVGHRDLLTLPPVRAA